MQTITFLLFVFFAAVAGAPSDDRIHNGLPEPAPVDPESDPFRFPFIVSIQENDKHLCGGYIYSPRWIVTAASCVEGKIISTLTIVAGQLNLIDIELSEQRIPVFRIFNNDQYDSTVSQEHDLALLELSADINLDGIHSYNIEFNEVFTDEFLAPDGTIIGWGETVKGGAASSRLRSASVTMAEDTPSLCGTFTEDEFNIQTMICGTPSLTGTAASPCSYDKGGPLIQTYDASTSITKTIAVGVLSRVNEECDATGSAIYTRLSAYYAWLYRTAGQPVGTTPAP